MRGKIYLAVHRTLYATFLLVNFIFNLKHLHIVCVLPMRKQEKKLRAVKTFINSIECSNYNHKNFMCIAYDCYEMKIF